MLHPKEISLVFAVIFAVLHLTYGKKSSYGQEAMFVSHQSQGFGLERKHHQEAGTSKPIIGILAQRCHDCPGRSYIAAGFVKWIEAAGARAVPIRYYSSDQELYRLFKSVNGLIFPGGLTDLYHDNPYVIAARKLWNWAKEVNEQGNVFPIYGTCLGFQLLHLLESNASFTDLLVDTDSVAQPSTIQLTDDAKGSKLLGTMDADLLDAMEDDDKRCVVFLISF